MYTVLHPVRAGRQDPLARFRAARAASRGSGRRQPPRLAVILLLVVVLLVRCGVSDSASGTVAALTAPALRPPAPAGELMDISGSRIAISDFRGRPVILNFWASWCAPCRHEIPSLAAVHRRLSARGLVILAVSVDEDRSALDRYLREDRPPFRILADPGRSVASRYGVSGIPVSFLLDSEGRVAERVDGDVDWTDPVVFGAIEGLLAESGDAR
jgi:peroxiredoxin